MRRAGPLTAQPSSNKVLQLGVKPNRRLFSTPIFSSTLSPIPSDPLDVEEATNHRVFATGEEKIFIFRGVVGREDAVKGACVGR